uniref:Sphingomyelin phosphodiesterase n=1 Tax=Haemonchus contortus TaxID=6289 RepID=A0A7I4Y9B1_HAECO|nr:Metallophosphoesterase domain containing protein [Haemonchus contortus]
MAKLFWVLFAILILFAFLGDSYSIPKRSNELRRRANSSTDSLRFSPLCVPCTAAVWTMWLAMKLDMTESVVLEFASLICKLVAKQSWVVCDGITTQFRDEFFYVFRRLADKSPSEICGLILNECSDPDDPDESGWTVALPPKPTKEIKALLDKKKAQFAQPPVPGQRYFRVLQLSDMHVDFEYEPGSEAECDLPICCRPSTGTPQKPAGYWGTVGRCDIPYRTLRNMLEHIKSTHEIDYIMLSGDFINHADWSYSVDEHMGALRNVSALIRQYFPMTPTYWAIGNHEGVPVNSFAPHFVDERFWPIWLYEEFLNMSSPWLNDEASKTVLYRGSYSVKVIDGLRLISLNTGFCENTNFFLYLNQSDPDGTMSWFVTELFKAELSGESVHVLSHIPPGDGECLEGWARNYYRVVQRFSDTIKAQFFGHVHFDHFTVFYEDMHNISSTPIGVLYAAPSVTTFADMNPAYRIYEVDYSDEFKVVDIKNYYADLTKADEKKPPKWELLYTAKAKYGLRDLSPTSWNNVVNSIFQEARTARKYTRNAFRTRKPACDTECQLNLLCLLRMGHHNSTLYCPQALPQRRVVLTDGNTG